MTRVGTVLLGTMLVLAMSADASAQGRGRGGAPPCATLACDLQADWTRSSENFYNLVNAMPEDKFGFKPTPAQQTFAERVMHVVTIDLNLLGALGGKTPAPAVNAKATSKADVLAALKQWSSWGDAVIKEFNDQQLLERVMPPGFMGPSASRARLIAFELQHTQDIYGQLVVYVRLNGVTPPASNRGGV